AEGRLVRRAAVVVAELDEDVVAGLQSVAHLVPQAFRIEGAAAPSGARGVYNGRLRGVEVRCERIAPSGMVRIIRGRVAHYVDGGSLGRGGGAQQGKHDRDLTGHMVSG